MEQRKRTYGDSCGIARALDLVGERWTLLVARELLLGPKRFTDLRTGLPGVSADVLSQRLRELEAAGVVRRRVLPAPAAARIYELTDWGRELEPVLHALGRWGRQTAVPDPAPPLSADAAVVALQTTFDPAIAGNMTATYELQLGTTPFAIRIADQRIDARQGTAEDAVAAIATDTATLASVLWHGRPLEEALADASLRIDGDRPAAELLLGTFAVQASADMTDA